LRRSVDLSDGTSQGLLNAAIATLAARQHGVVSLGQLVALGLTPSAVRDRVASGSLHRIHRGVYAVGHPHITARGRRMAAVLAYGRAALSHTTAAAHLGLLNSESGIVHVTTSGRGKSRPGIRAHSGATLLERDVVRHEGIPTTSWARTLLDIAPSVSRRALERALDRTMTLELFDLRTLEDVLGRARGRAGAGLIRRVLADHGIGTTETRTGFEEALFSIVDGAGIRRPVCNYVIEVGEEEPISVDFAWIPERVAVEFDSWRWHSAPIAQARDKRRYRALTLAGWMVLPMSERDVAEPERVAGEIRSALNQ
jgi:hypothetical protein